MGSTYTCTGLVLSKTKLGETDLIVTLLDRSGAQRRAVAKGARKPSSSFAARLELFSEVDLLIAQGKSLDIVKEARLIDAHTPLRTSLQLCATASVCVELLKKCTRESLSAEKLYALTHATFRAMESAPVRFAPVLAAAFLIKAVSMMGFQPALVTCATCGGSLDTQAACIPFSFSEGGCLCSACGTGADAVYFDATTMAALRVLLGSTLADVVADESLVAEAFSCLSFCKGWLHTAVDEHLKSLDYLLTCGLF